MENKPTYEQAQLHLQVYEQRREARLRQARDWFFQKYHVETIDDAMRIAAPGTEGGAFAGMVVSYWEQACALLNYGLLHRQDSMVVQGIANWTALGLLAFGPFVDEASAAPPYGGTHALVTDRLPLSGTYVNAHGSVARDDYTPRAKDGTTPALRDAWQYVLAARHGDDGDDRDNQDGRDGEEAND